MQNQNKILKLAEILLRGNLVQWNVSMQWKLQQKLHLKIPIGTLFKRNLLAEVIEKNDAVYGCIIPVCYEFKI